jgi:hypothetical protein
LIYADKWKAQAQNLRFASKFADDSDNTMNQLLCNCQQYRLFLTSMAYSHLYIFCHSLIGLIFTEAQVFIDFQVI